MNVLEELHRETRSLRVAVIHDWMFVRRGGEKVLEAMLDLFPEADLFHLFGKPEVLKTHEPHRTTASFLASVPGIGRLYKMMLPLLPVAIESFNLQGYDLVLSSSSCVAKGVIPHPGALHVSYIHSPMRYAWDQEHQYFPSPPRLGSPIELLRRIWLSRLRQWDVTSAQRCDLLIANSRFVARRIALYYGRPATVVHPPVDVSRFGIDTTQPKPEPNGARKVLLFGAWVPYKSMRWALELLIANNIPVVAAGQGKELEECARRHAGRADVEFVISPSDSRVRELYSEAHTILFPAIEDFGIVPLEATASGMFVVAPNVGGTAETVIDGVTGRHFQPGNGEAMMAAVKDALATPKSPETLATLRKHAEQFSYERFRNAYARSVLDALRKHRLNLTARNT
jgi:glycosyltransferase involved in cell wall biosynthesis